MYDRWSWLPVFIVFLIVASELGRSGNFRTLPPLRTGHSEAGSLLSFAASTFGSAIGWTSSAPYYTVYQPARASRCVIFGWTLLGDFFSIVFSQPPSAAVMTASASRGSDSLGDHPYAQAYDNKVGELIATVLVPSFGDRRLCPILPCGVGAIYRRKQVPKPLQRGDFTAGAGSPDGAGATIRVDNAGDGSIRGDFDSREQYVREIPGEFHAVDRVLVCHLLGGWH